MLSPFPGLVLDAAGPVTRSDAAAWGRAVRDAPEADRALHRLSPYRAEERSRLYRYSIDAPTGRVYQGLIGVVAVGSLVPHEETLAHQPVTPPPTLEIRPLLAITRHRLPDLPESGPESSVVYGRLLHRLTPVEVPQGGVPLRRPVLVDGHHRRRSLLAHLGPRARAMVLVVGEGGRGLRAESFQRLLPGVGDLPDAATDLFEVTEQRAAIPRRGALVWIRPNRPALLLRPRSEALATIDGPLREVEIAVAARLLYPLLGVTEEDVAHFSTTLGTRHSLEPDDAALLLPRIGADRVLAVAEAGMLLPPKGSRFRPKPVRGLVIHTGHTAVPKRSSTRR